jgi:hypothetical protein
MNRAKSTFPGPYSTSTMLWGMVGNKIYPYNPTIMHRVLSLLFLSLLLTAVLQADVLPPCAPGTLASYEQTPCSIGQLNYDSFTFDITPTGGDTAANIWLTPAAQGFNFEHTPDGGSTFTQFSSTTFTRYLIGYRFIIDPTIASGAELGMDPPSGDVQITASYCNESFGPNSDGFCTPPPTSVGGGGFRADVFQVHTNPTNPDPCFDASGADTCFDQHDFLHPAFTFGNVLIEIDLDGSPTSPAAFDSTSTGTFLVAETPEPGSVVLLLSGLAIITIRRRFPWTRPAGRV